VAPCWPDYTPAYLARPANRHPTRHVADPLERAIEQLDLAHVANLLDDTDPARGGDMVPARDGRRAADVGPDRVPAVDLVAQQCALEPDLGRDVGDEARLAAAAGGADEVAVDEAAVNLSNHFSLVDLGTHTGGMEHLKLANPELKSSAEL